MITIYPPFASPCTEYSSVLAEYSLAILPEASISCTFLILLGFAILKNSAVGFGKTKVLVKLLALTNSAVESELD